MTCHCCEVWRKRFNHIRMQISMIEEQDRADRKNRWECEK